MSSDRCGLLQGQPGQSGWRAFIRLGDNRRADAFQIYYLFINGGVIVSPLITGTLGEKVGWHWGFGAAGVGMLIGLTIYLAGRSFIPPDSPVVEQHQKHTAKPPLKRRDKVAIIALLAVITRAHNRFYRQPTNLQRLSRVGGDSCETTGLALLW